MLGMLLLDSQLTASQVLRTFHRDEIFLFLGAAFTTIGLVIAGFLLIRRRFDALLFWLALFAILYGTRMWMISDLFSLIIPASIFFDRLRASASFLVPVPAFFFFLASGFLGSWGKPVIYPIVAIAAGLQIGTWFGVPLTSLYDVNNYVVLCALVPLTVRSFLHKPETRDFVIIRNGLLIFIAFVFWNNIGSLRFGTHTNVEPYGFAIFLGCLGYVAARRTVERDQQFSALQKELEVAKRIQLSILPAAFPPSAHFQVAARYVPMTSVAGDFYDFFVPQDGKAGLLIADVSGHGVPAALIASMVKVAATSQREHAAHPAKLLAGMNATLCGNTQGQFVTAAYVHLDAHNEELRYAAAGHLPMLLVRNGQVIAIEENGLVLALFDHADYSAMSQRLEIGDRLLLYTDGIVEAEDASQEQFGHARLCELLLQSMNHSPAETADLILDHVEQWSVSQDDDRTLLVCDYVRNI